MNLYQRLWRYIGNRIWIYKKRREITKALNAIIVQKFFFDRETEKYGEDARNGTKDISLMRLYKLKGKGLSVFGTSVFTMARLSSTLVKADRVLDRFSRKIKKEGWWNDTMATHKKDRELYRKKQEVITAEFSRIQVHPESIQIPD